MKHILFRLTTALAVAAVLTPASAQQTVTVAPGSVPEFGTMWTFDAPPLEYWQARHGFAASQEWLDHLRLSSVRLSGCSSSFVSPDGLVMTNHHCARGCIATVSPEDTNYLRTGFTAETREDEVTCPGMYADQLVAIEDVTERVRSRVTSADAAEQVAQREAAVTEIRGECEEATGMRCQVVAFYDGGMYSLYTYRRYDELRLVFAPELEAAAFGGDPDNFTYPRHDLDVSFLRAYENGQPVHPDHWLEWSDAGAAEGETVFVVGNPGSTGRLLTLAQMEYLRDVEYPARIADYQRRLDVLRELSSRSPEHARRYETQILGIENSFKATNGYLTGLLDESIMARKEAFENDFRGRIQADPALDARFGSAWDEIAGAQLEIATFADQVRYYGLGGSTLLDQAASLVRLARQETLPTDLRMDARALERARERLLRDRPLDRDRERLELASWLAAARRDLGDTDPLVRALLGPRTPEEAAEQFIRESRLVDAAERQALLDGGLTALRACPDPLVAAALELAPTAESFDRRRAELATVISANTEKLGRAIFEAYGTALPPDATFTLRISDGVVKGFPMNGTIAPYKTTFYSLYGRSAEFDDQPPFQLTESWKAAERRVDMKTPMNFVSTADIIGGNSGSPVVNTAGEVVGLVFDGNIEMLPNRFLFTDEVSRCVSVHSMAITEALEVVYGAGHLVEELTGGGR
ncbi:MAG: S46 family peptidase [Gemmatimonadota bacterium]|jgi:hypothetical protein